MFDDPQKNLRRLQEQLLAAEEAEEEAAQPDAPGSDEPEPEEELHSSPDPTPVRNTRPFGWVLAALLLELGAVLLLLAWWLQWK